MEHDTTDDPGDATPGPESLEVVADRLEAALERLARHLDHPAPDTARGAAAAVTARLDRLIVRMRDALSRADDASPGSMPTGSMSGGSTPDQHAPDEHRPDEHTPHGHAAD